ncbi:MAG: SDR family oxidoreductase [bacterium]|nr:SDR family oxidoreductase [bacterium]
MNTLIIGAGRKGNIGYAIAKKFEQEGHRVMVADITYDHDEFEQYTCDVTNPNTIHLMMRAISNTVEHLDAIINSAGVNILNKLERYTLEDFNTTIAVNLTSNFLLLQAYVWEFDNNGKRKAFVAITSDTGMIPKTSTFAYGASKAGANHFIRCTARELNKYHNDDWLVTALAIGRVYTPMDRKTITDLMEQRGITEEQAENMLSANIPIGRGMTPEECAEWAYFVTTKGDYATGNVLRIDAGQVQG